MESLVDFALPPEVAVPAYSATAPSGMRDKASGVERINVLEGLSKIRDDWDDLEARFGAPLLSYSWSASCAQTLCRPENLHIILVRYFGRVRAIAPLSLQGRFRRRLEILGSSVTDEPGGMLFSDESALAELIRAMVDAKVHLLLKGLKLASPECRILENELRSRKVRALVREKRVPWVATRGTWENFESQISSSRRSSLRRLQRLAESKGKLEFSVSAPTPETVDKDLGELFEVEASSWKARTGTALKSYKELGNFFRRYSHMEAAKQNLRVLHLRVGGRVIAGQLAVVHANRLWILKIGHDESWSWCSPGVLLMHRAIGYCFEKGLDACEMLGSDEPWLHIWANESHSIVTYRIYPNMLDEIIGLTGDVARMCFYKLSKRLAKKR